MVACDDKLTFSIAMTFMVILLSAMTVKCIHDVYEDMFPSPSHAFRDSLTDASWDATLLQRGYYYVGTCDGMARDDGGVGDQPCSAGQDADDLCKDYVTQEYPYPPGANVFLNPTDRKLSQRDGEFGGHDNNDTREVLLHVPPRQLRDVKCHNMYVPWWLLNVTVAGKGTDETQVVTRCAFRFGTMLNSQTHDFRMALQDVPSEMKVWTSPAMGNCVVGTGQLTDLHERVAKELPPKEGLIPLMGVFIWLSVCFLLSAIRGCFAADPASKKGDETEDETEDD